MIGLDPQARAVVEDDLLGIFFGIPSRCGREGDILTGTTKEGHDARGQVGSRQLEQSGIGSFGAKGPSICIALRPARREGRLRSGA